MQVLPDAFVCATIKIVNGTFYLMASGGESIVLDASSGMTLNDLLITGMTLAFGELSDPPDTVTIGHAPDEVLK